MRGEGGSFAHLSGEFTSTRGGKTGHPVRFVLVCALWVGTSASAQVLSSPERGWLTGGVSYRDHQQRTPAGALSIHVGGTSQSIAPWNLHFSGALFFNRFLGVNLEARGDLFYATQAGTTPVPQPSFELTPSAVARWVPARWFSLEGQLGWALHLRSVITGGPKETDFLFTGPSLGVAVGLAPGRWLSGQLFLRAQPVAFSLGGVRGFGGRVYAAGAQLSVGAMRVGALQLSGAITFELSSVRFESSASIADQQGARLGVGVSVARAPVEVDAVPEPVVPTVTLAGRAQSAEGAGLAGVVVTLDGENPARTDDAGAFSFTAVPVGMHVVRARKDGLAPALQEVNVTAVPGAVVLTLVAPTGPGRIRGVVRSGEAPLPGAVLVAGEVTASSDGEGRFVLEGVGPGPVTVRVTKAEFTDAEEVAQVPAAAEATLDFTLVPKTTEVRATLRGLIRAKSGEMVKATVRVVELKLKLPVKADGRFSADVPSGHYTLIIEARGFITQTKSVEVSGGDQAIFHTELEPSR